jgi:hypothetical protein
VTVDGTLLLLRIVARELVVTDLGDKLIVAHRGQGERR